MLALCALALPMLALRAPAVRALAVRLRAGRVVCLCSARLHRADFVRRRSRPHFQRQGRNQADLLRHTLDSHFCLHYHLPPVRLTRGSVVNARVFHMSCSAAQYLVQMKNFRIDKH